MGKDKPNPVDATKFLAQLSALGRSCTLAHWLSTLDMLLLPFSARLSRGLSNSLLLTTGITTAVHRSLFCFSPMPVTRGGGVPSSLLF